MKPDLECLWTKSISGCSTLSGDLYWMKGLRPIDTGFVSFWGCLLYLKGPVRNIRQAAFLHDVFTVLVAILATFNLAWDTNDTLPDPKPALQHNYFKSLYLQRKRVL